MRKSNTTTPGRISGGTGTRNGGSNNNSSSSASSTSRLFHIGSTPTSSIGRRYYGKNTLTEYKVLDDDDANVALLHDRSDHHHHHAAGDYYISETLFEEGCEAAAAAADDDDDDDDDDAGDIRVLPPPALQRRTSSDKNTNYVIAAPDFKSSTNNTNNNNNNSRTTNQRMTRPPINNSLTRRQQLQQQQQQQQQQQRQQQQQQQQNNNKMKGNQNIKTSSSINQQQQQQLQDINVIPPPSATGLFRSGSSGNSAYTNSNFCSGVTNPPSSSSSIEVKRQKSMLSLYQSTPITKHYEVSKQILSAFDSHYNDTMYMTAYCVGLQFIETVLIEIPKHGYYYSARHEPERVQSAWDAARVTFMLENIIRSAEADESASRKGIELIQHYRAMAMEQMEKQSIFGNADNTSTSRGIDTSSPLKPPRSSRRASLSSSSKTANNNNPSGSNESGGGWVNSVCDPSYFTSAAADFCSKSTPAPDFCARDTTSNNNNDNMNNKNSIATTTALPAIRNQEHASALFDSAAIPSSTPSSPESASSSSSKKDNHQATKKQQERQPPKPQHQKRTTTADPPMKPPKQKIQQKPKEISLLSSDKTISSSREASFYSKNFLADGTSLHISSFASPNKLIMSRASSMSSSGWMEGSMISLLSPSIDSSMSRNSRLRGSSHHHDSNQGSSIQLEKALFLSGLSLVDLNDDGDGGIFSLSESDAAVGSYFDASSTATSKKEDDESHQRFDEKSISSNKLSICRSIPEDQQQEEPRHPLLDRSPMMKEDNSALLQLQTLAALYQDDFISLQKDGRVRILFADTYQGRIPESTNGCAVIAPLLCIHHILNTSNNNKQPMANGNDYYYHNRTHNNHHSNPDDEYLTNAEVVHVLDVETPVILKCIRDELGLSPNAFLIPSDVHDYLLQQGQLHPSQFLTVTGGNVLDERHLNAFIDALVHETADDPKQQQQQHPQNQNQPKRRIAATFFFHEHVVSILKVRTSSARSNSNGGIDGCYEFMDSLPLKRTYRHHDNEQDDELFRRLKIALPTTPQQQQPKPPPPPPISSTSLYYTQSSMASASSGSGGSGGYGNSSHSVYGDHQNLVWDSNNSNRDNRDVEATLSGLSLYNNSSVSENDDECSTLSSNIVTIPKTFRTRCSDSEALAALIRWYACSMFTTADIAYINQYDWDDSTCDFDPRVFQAFIWSSSG